MYGVKRLPGSPGILGAGAAWSRRRGIKANATVRSEGRQRILPRLCTPRVPLTDNQYEDYRSLLSEARALTVLGQHQDARRVMRLAAHILRTSAPGLE